MARFDLLRGYLAARRVTQNPEDTEQVFKVLGAMRGRAHEYLYGRLRSNAVGREIIEGKRDLAAVLSDRTRLQSLPAGSLGRAYFEFTERENISADGLIHASAELVDSIPDARFRNIAARMRDSHDLWHVVTAYGRDPLGEVCLLAFTHAQTKNPAILLLILVAFRKLIQACGWRVVKALRKARRDGQYAAWLPTVDWELLLAEPLSKVQLDFNVDVPRPYQMILHELQLNPS